MLENSTQGPSYVFLCSVYEHQKTVGTFFLFFFFPYKRLKIKCYRFSFYWMNRGISNVFHTINRTLIRIVYPCVPIQRLNSSRYVINLISDLPIILQQWHCILYGGRSDDGVQNWTGFLCMYRYFGLQAKKQKMPPHQSIFLRQNIYKKKIIITIHISDQI